MEKTLLMSMRSEGMSIRAIASKLGCSYTAVRYWMRRYDLDTSRTDKRSNRSQVCRSCGEKRPEMFYQKPSTECKKCFNRRRTQNIQRNRSLVIQMLGGRCYVCGYARCEPALELHHTDSLKKDPKYSTLRSSKIGTLLDEARKCVLVCANCHRELHARLITLPL
jgi:transposase-like protein